MAENQRGSGPAEPGHDGLLRLLCVGAVAGAILLAVSQFMNLYGTHVQARHLPVASATVGADHAYAMLPIAAVVVLLAYGVWRAASRPALLGIGVLGLLALLITLIHDLPYSHRQGLRSLSGHYVLAVNRPEIGLYVQTLGALVLLLVCASGFVLLGAPRRDTVGTARPAHDHRA